MLKVKPIVFFGRHPHTATHHTFTTTDGFAFETFAEMMAHLRRCNGTD
jgi:hypothetical protein